MASRYLVAVLAAAVILAAEGVSFLLAGSAALWLHAEPIPVADADVLVAARADAWALRRWRRAVLQSSGWRHGSGSATTVRAS